MSLNSSNHPNLQILRQDLLHSKIILQEFLNWLYWLYKFTLIYEFYNCKVSYICCLNKCIALYIFIFVKNEVFKYMGRKPICLTQAVFKTIFDVKHM